MTHTLAEMGLPPSVFELIKKKLLEAGYTHAMLEEDDGVMLDMTGIGVVSEDMERSDATNSSLHYINDTPFMLSLLYDMGLMPEQLVEGSFQWGYMMGIVWSHMNREAIAKNEKGDNDD